MIRSRSIRPCIALLALAFFALPASGAHLHLCLDGTGSEPPASVHVSDGGIHHSTDADRAHNDVSASFKSEALAKKLRSSFDLPTSLPAALVLFDLPDAASVDFPREPASPTVPIPAHWVIPPQRAPPV